MKQLLLCIICYVACFESYAQTIIPFETRVNTHELSDPTLKLLSTSDNSATFSFDVEDVGSLTQCIDGAEYSTFYINGLGMIDDTGKPTLPVYQKWIEVTDKSSIISVISSTSNDQKDIIVYPTQIQRIENDTKQQDSFYIDSVFYSLDTYYPNNIVEVSNVVSFRGKKYAVVRICPIQYNPKQKIVRCYSNIEFNLTNYANSSKDERSNRDNISTIQDDYFIVCKNNAKTFLTTFITWKKQQGYKVHLISKSSWSNTTQVKDSISAHYNQCNSNSNKYLLIVGNHSMVPTGYEYYNPDLGSGEYFATDYAYSCIENGGDGVRDIAIGRIPFTTGSELRTILNKIMDYQKHPFYSGKALNIGYFERDSIYVPDPIEDAEARRFIRTCEDTKQFIDSQGFSTQRIYYAKLGVHPYYYSDIYSDGSELSCYLRNNYSWNGNGNMIINAISDSIPNILLYRGHGSDNAWSSLSTDTSYIHQLHNNKYPIVLSITCHTGKFAKYANSTITSQPCLATEFLRQSNGGAVTVIAPTEKTYSGYNDFFTAGLYDTMFPNNLNIKYGDVLGGSINGSGAYITNFSQLFHDNCRIGDAINITCYKMFNSNLVCNHNKLVTTCKRMHCFGDPTTEIYTGQPEDLSVVTVKQINDSLIVDTHGIQNCSVLFIPNNSTNSNQFFRVDSVSGEVAFPNIRIPYSISVQKHNCATCYIKSPDIYIQNMDFTDTLYNFKGNHVYIGMDVTEDVEHNEVNVKTGSSLILTSDEGVEIQDHFEVESGGTLEIW